MDGTAILSSQGCAQTASGALFCLLVSQEWQLGRSRSQCTGGRWVWISAGVLCGERKGEGSVCGGGVWGGLCVWRAWYD